MVESSGEAAGREKSAGMFHKVLKDVSATSWYHEARAPSVLSLSPDQSQKGGVREGLGCRRVEACN